MICKWKCFHYSDILSILYNKNFIVDVIFSKRSKNVDISETLVKVLNEKKVPTALLKFIKNIKLTILRKNTGYFSYNNNIVFIDCRKKNRKYASNIFLHEVGHAVDYYENITNNKKLVDEMNNDKTETLKKYADRNNAFYDNKNVAEYFAIGFELYYMGDNIEKIKIKNNNKLLYKTINKLHKKYSKEK